MNDVIDIVLTILVMVLLGIIAVMAFTLPG